MLNVWQIIKHINIMIIFATDKNEIIDQLYLKYEREGDCGKES